MPDLRLRSVVVVCRRSDIWFGLPGDWHWLGLGPQASATWRAGQPKDRPAERSPGTRFPPKEGR